jgi:hypothetical protein
MLDTDHPIETGAWHPKIHSLYGYWLKIHPGAGLPGRRHFEPMDIPQLLPNLWLLDVERDPLRFRYRLVGTKLAEFFGKAIKGGYLGDSTKPHFTEQHLAHYEDVVANRIPHYRRGQPAFAVDRSMLVVERIILPLASDGSAVDMILALTVLLDEQGKEI